MTRDSSQCRRAALDGVADCAGQQPVIRRSIERVGGRKTEGSVEARVVGLAAESEADRARAVEVKDDVVHACLIQRTRIRSAARNEHGTEECVEAHLPREPKNFGAFAEAQPLLVGELDIGVARHELEITELRVIRGRWETLHVHLVGVELHHESGDASLHRQRDAAADEVVIQADLEDPLGFASTGDLDKLTQLIEELLEHDF